MSEIPIFISYAHLDDRPMPPDTAGWISKFHQALETRLGQLVGTDLRIWRDNLMSGNDYLWDTIGNRLEKGGILISVLTPRYIRSEACLKELQGYYSSSARCGGIRVRDKAKIFKVVKTPYPLDGLPPELREILDYPFFQVDPKGVAREFELDLDLDNRRHFLNRLYDLAHDIQALMGLLAEGDGGQVPAKGTVFLAETSYDVAPQRDEIRRDLQQRGYEVLPARAIPWDTPDFREAIRTDLARSTLSVHLIGASSGIVPEGEEEPIVALQNELAAEQSAARFFPRLLWLPESLQVKQKRQQDFIDQLLNDRSAHAGLELLRNPLEELKTVLQDKLHARVPPPLPPASRRARVYLICHESDLDAIGELQECLYERGCDVDTPLFAGSEAERGEYHKELLQMSDAAIVYYGKAGEAWLRFKLLDLRKAPGYRDPARPPLAQAVYVTAPDTAQKQQLKSHELQLIRSFGAFSAGSLDPFLADLENSQKAA